jgi:hypothetical protein
VVDLISVLDELSTQSKLKNILWRESVTQRIDEVYRQLSAAVRPLDVSVPFSCQISVLKSDFLQLSSQLDFSRFQQEHEAARKLDTDQLHRRLEALNENAREIIHASQINILLHFVLGDHRIHRTVPWGGKIRNEGGVDRP